MIEIYGRDNCTFCMLAKELCELNQLPYEYKDVTNVDIEQELLDRTLGFKTVPQIYWHNRYIGGYTDFARELENTRNFGQDQF